jgi:CheY-like chemotaxis protein
VVDDHPVNRLIVRVFLTPHGFDVVEAHDGRHALDLLDQQPFDLVLMDAHMPVMDGLETVRRMRASDRPWARLPVIALTADAMPGDRERYLGAGMTGYVTKPVEHIDLVRTVVVALQDGAGSPGA